MSWTTLYIAGKLGFKEEVLKNLDDASFSYLPGNTEGESDLLLLWVDEALDLQTLKRAIGSKTLFKYRLHFYNTVNQVPDKKTDPLTAGEEALIRKMNEWEAERFRHSA